MARDTADVRHCSRRSALQSLAAIGAAGLTAATAAGRGGEAKSDDGPGQSGDAPGLGDGPGRGDEVRAARAQSPVVAANPVANPVTLSPADAEFRPAHAGRPQPVPGERPGHAAALSPPSPRNAFEVGGDA